MIAKRLNKMHLSGNDAAKADRGVGVALLNANIWNGQARKELGIHGNLQDHTSIETLVNATPPDMVSLSKIIKEMKSSDAGEKAEEIIDLLLSRYKYCGSEDVLPDAQLFTSGTSFTHSVHAVLIALRLNQTGIRTSNFCLGPKSSIERSREGRTDT